MFSVFGESSLAFFTTVILSEISVVVECSWDTKDGGRLEVDAEGFLDLFRGIGLEVSKLHSSVEMFSLSLSIKSDVFRYDIRRSTSDFVINPHWSAEYGITSADFREASWVELLGAQWILRSSHATHICGSLRYYNEF